MRHAGRAVLIGSLLLMIPSSAGRAGVVGDKPTNPPDNGSLTAGFAQVDHAAMTRQHHRLDSVGTRFPKAYGGTCFDEGTGELTVRYVPDTLGSTLVAEAGSLPAKPHDVPVRFETVKTSIGELSALVDRLDSSRVWAGDHAAVVHQVWLDELRLQIRIEASGAPDELRDAVRAATGFTPSITVSAHGLVKQ